MSDNLQMSSNYDLESLLHIIYLSKQKMRSAETQTKAMLVMEMTVENLYRFISFRIEMMTNMKDKNHPMHLFMDDEIYASMLDLVKSRFMVMNTTYSTLVAAYSARYCYDESGIPYGVFNDSVTVYQTIKVWTDRRREVWSFLDRNHINVPEDYQFILYRKN